MPEISRFFGVVIRMFYEDHTPAHFHVEYNEYRAKVNIEDLTLIDGKLPSRVLGFVIEWASIHQNELRSEWQHALNREKLNKIAPLE
ncbi:MAG TPA: transcriptional regulator [Bacteroidetes bacterium]|nr:transcriptional regulator [Bacteroidota bacterium]